MIPVHSRAMSILPSRAKTNGKIIPDYRPSHLWRRIRDHVEGWRKLAKIHVVANVLQTFVMKILIVNAAKQDRSKYA